MEKPGTFQLANTTIDGHGCSTAVENKHMKRLASVSFFLGLYNGVLSSLPSD